VFPSLNFVDACQAKFAAHAGPLRADDKERSGEIESVTIPARRQNADTMQAQCRHTRGGARTMAFWIRKKGEEGEGGKDGEASAGSLKPTKKKDEKKENKPKRIDNLRIPQQLRVTLRSLGSPNEFVFLTKDLSATGAFVLCSNFKRYPFQQTSTLLDCVVELKVPEAEETYRLTFLAKIARVVEAKGEGALSISGFGVRIVQISQDQRVFLESFIQRHGAPDVNNAAADLAGLLPANNVLTPAHALGNEEEFDDVGDGLLTDEDDEDVGSLPRAV
jgi:hypothetical protein